MCKISFNPLPSTFLRKCVLILYYMYSNLQTNWFLQPKIKKELKVRFEWKSRASLKYPCLYNNMFALFICLQHDDNEAFL